MNYLKISYFYFVLFSLLFLFIPQFLTLFNFSFSSIKYVRFLCPSLFIFIVIFNYKGLLKFSHKDISYDYVTLILKFYVFISLLTFFTSSFIFNLNFSFRNFVNIVLLVTPLIYLFVISLKLNYFKVKYLIYILFYSFSFLYFSKLLEDGVSFSEISNIILGINIVNSDIETESTLSLVFCFFSLFFLSLKNYKLFFISFILTILGGKRIAVAGLIISVISFYLLDNGYLKNFFSKRIFSVLFAISLTLFATIWFNLYSGLYDDIISYFFNINTNAFLMGRLTIAREFFSYKPDDFDYFLGYGIGYIENVLYNRANIERLFHNDFLRFVMEFGYFLFFIWAYINISFLKSNPLSFSCFVLLLVLMQTDNVFLYESVMYSFYTIICFSFKFYNK